MSTDQDTRKLRSKRTSYASKGNTYVPKNASSMYGWFTSGFSDAKILPGILRICSINASKGGNGTRKTSRETEPKYVGNLRRIYGISIRNKNFLSCSISNTSLKKLPAKLGSPFPPIFPGCKFSPDPETRTNVHGHRKLQIGGNACRTLHTRFPDKGLASQPQTNVKI